MKIKNCNIESNDHGINVTVNKVPNLFRYQSINKYTTNALLKDELWGTTPIAFNDPYDMCCCFSPIKIKNAIREKVNNGEYRHLYELVQVKTDEEFVSYLYDFLCKDMNNTLKQQYAVVCFSEKNDSEIMWAHYANCATGFVLEYNGEYLRETVNARNDEINDVLCSIFGVDQVKQKQAIAPVVYLNGKYNCTEIILNLINDTIQLFQERYNKNNNADLDYLKYVALKNEDNNLFYSIFCNKTKDWSYEKEWRIWTHNTNLLINRNNEKYVMIAENIIPEAIYLGEYISDYDKIIMKEIAKNKQIPLYEMKTKMYKNRFKLIAQKVQ